MGADSLSLLSRACPVQDDSFPLLWTLSPTQKGVGVRARGHMLVPRAWPEGQWLCLGALPSSCLRNAQARLLASPALLHLLHPHAQPSLEKGEPLPFSLPSAAQPLSLAPDDNLFYVLSASLPRLSAFSLFMCCFLRRCIFSYNIMSDPDFPKSTLSGLTASPVSLPAGQDLHRGPSSTQWGPPLPAPTPIQGVTIHIFISKATPGTSTTNPS